MEGDTTAPLYVFCFHSLLTAGEETQPVTGENIPAQLPEAISLPFLSSCLHKDAFQITLGFLLLFSSFPILKKNLYLEIAIHVNIYLQVDTRAAGYKESICQVILAHYVSSLHTVSVDVTFILQVIKVRLREGK